MTAMREIRIHPMLPDTPVAWPLPTWLDTAAAARWRPGRGGTPWDDLDDDTRVWVAAETIRLVVGASGDARPTPTGDTTQVFDHIGAPPRTIPTGRDDPQEALF